MSKEKIKTDALTEKLIVNPLIPEDTAVLKMADGLYAIIDKDDYNQLLEIPLCFAVRIFHRVEINLGEQEEEEAQITYQFQMYEDEQFKPTHAQRKLISELNQGYRYTGPEIPQPTATDIENNSERTLGFMSTTALFQWLQNLKEDTSSE